MISRKSEVLTIAVVKTERWHMPTLKFASRLLVLSEVMRVHKPSVFKGYLTIVERIPLGKH